MVAGATGIDLYLMVVAADDGVMPQTREHATVLRALGVEVGVVAVTKADLADPARARAEAEELLPGAEVVASRPAPAMGSTSCAPRSTARRTVPRAATHPARAPAHRPRVHDPRRRHGRHRHAVGGQRRRAATP